MSQPKQIYIGGWARFREECGATKKEPFEDFSWMGSPILGTDAVYDPSGRADYEDCRDAVARVEGGKEYIKTYVATGGLNFQDEIGQQIQLHGGHSGASGACMLWSYKRLLNDWDDWVLQQKEHHAYNEYKKRQADEHTIHYLMRLGNPHSFPPSEDSTQKIKDILEIHGLTVSVEEGVAIATQIWDEFVARRMRLQKEQEAQRFLDRVEELEFKYKHPFRWFDTKYGSSIGLSRVSEITPELMAEMTRRHPDYREHIQNLRRPL